MERTCPLYLEEFCGMALREVQFCLGLWARIHTYRVMRFGERAREEMTVITLDERIVSISNCFG